MARKTTLVDMVVDDNLAIENMRRQIASLQAMVGQIAQQSALETILANGFEKVSGMLSGIGQLAPSRAPLSDQEKAILAAIHASLDRPDYSFIEQDIPDDFGAPKKKTAGGAKK